MDKKKASEAVTKNVNKSNKTKAVTIKEKKDKLSSMLHRSAPALQKIATKHLEPQKIIQLALRSAAKNPKILDCTPQSILGCVFESQNLGLEIDSMGQSYIVPFGKEAQFIIGYRGLISLAQRTGNILYIHADLVRDGDDFDYGYGSEHFLKHKPQLGPRDKDYKDVYAIYACAKTKDGGFYFTILTVEEVEKTRMRSPSARSSTSPWRTDWDSMAKKTAVRQLSKYLPVSSEYDRALKLDEIIAMGKSQRLDIDRVDEEDKALLIGDEGIFTEPEEIDFTVEETEPKEPKKTSAKGKTKGKAKKEELKTEKEGDDKLFKEEDLEDITNWENPEFVIDQIKQCKSLDALTAFKHEHLKQLEAFGGKDHEAVDQAYLEVVKELRGL